VPQRIPKNTFAKNTFAKNTFAKNTFAKNTFGGGKIFLPPSPPTEIPAPLPSWETIPPPPT